MWPLLGRHGHTAEKCEAELGYRCLPCALKESKEVAAGQRADLAVVDDGIFYTWQSAGRAGLSYAGARLLRGHLHTDTTTLLSLTIINRLVLPI